MWKLMKIQDKDFAISSRKENNVWNICLTDFVEIWSEELQSETIIKRCKTLNPLLKIEGLNIEEIMEEILTDIPQNAIKEFENNNNIKLQKNIQGGRFKFEIHLNKGSQEKFFEVITKSVYLLTIELFRKNSILLKAIRDKDVEIAEYKAEGAKLIRKNIETKPFTEDLLLMKESNSVLSFATQFKSLVNMCNEAENFKSQIHKFENSKRSNESTEMKIEIEENSNNKISSISNTNLPTKEIAEESLKRKQETKYLKAKKSKEAISASFTKPIRKPKSRVTNFIS